MAGRRKLALAVAPLCLTPLSLFSLLALPSFLPSFWCNYSNLAEIKWLGGGGGLGLRPGRQWHALASLAF